MKTKKADRNQARKQLIEGIQKDELSLPQAMKLARQVLNRNQQEYADLVGVTKKVIADFEVGKGNPTLATLNKIFAPVGLMVGLKLRGAG